MNNGLMQTLAFYQDKGKPHQEVLNQHIIGWLAASSLFTHQNNVPLNFNTMMEFLLKANSQQYRQATEETLALLRWIRQLAAIN
jgi:CRISPR-associated protein Cmr5